MGATNAFRTRPIASVAMVLTLSLGIGATLTLFAILHALVLREVPYPEPNRIVRIIPKRVGSPLTGLLSGFDFAEWRSNTRVLSALAGYSAERLVLGTSESATITEVVLVTPSMFRVLGTRPSLGRAFREEDAFSGANRVTIVCHKLWTERFGADPSLVGRTITLDGIPHVVVGVLPEWVRFPLPGAGVWLPLDPRSEVQSFEDGRKRVLVKHLSVVGRLLPSASIPAVRAEGEAVLREPRTRLEISSLWDDTTAGIRMALALTQVVTLLVLAIACANVANLLLAESVRSARDTALRLALGASRRSVLRGLVTTALLRTAPAGPLGYLLAWAGVEWFRRRVPGVGPPLTGAMLEPTVALVGVLLTVGSGVGASLWPAVRAIRSGLSLVASRHTSPDSGLHREVAAGEQAAGRVPDSPFLDACRRYRSVGYIRSPRAGIPTIPNRRRAHRGGLASRIPDARCRVSPVEMARSLAGRARNSGGATGGPRKQTTSARTGIAAPGRVRRSQRLCYRVHVPSWLDHIVRTGQRRVLRDARPPLYAGRQFQRSGWTRSEQAACLSRLRTNRCRRTSPGI